jgi:hypothetical protein
MAINYANVNLLTKVHSLGASFFRYFTRTVDTNNVITNMNNVGIVELITATTADTTTDFTTLQIGDFVFHVPAVAGNARAGVCAVVNTAPFAAVVGSFYIIVRPSA